MPKPESADHGAIFDFATIDRELRRDDSYERNGHAARTLIREPDLRIVLIVVKAGARIAEHQANETAAIHALSGNLRVHLPSRAVDLTSGQLLVLAAGLRHDVSASEDSSFLLTLGWSGSASPSEGQQR